MTLSDSRRITDELLSAYIDGQVTEQERAFVEAAIAADEGIAWRLNSLRQTVSLLHDLPELALPRSFTLTLDQVSMVQAEEQIAGVRATERELVMAPAAPAYARPTVAPIPPVEAGFWQQLAQGWKDFWQGGNPMLRNAAAVSFVLMLLLLGGGEILGRTAPQSASMAVTAPEAAPLAAPASSEATSGASAISLAPTATAAGALQSTTTATDVLQVQAGGNDQATPSEGARVMKSAPADAAATVASESTLTESAADQSEEPLAEAAPEDQAIVGSASIDSATESAPEAATASDSASAEVASAAAASAPAEEMPMVMAAPVQPQAAENYQMSPVPMPSGGGVEGVGPQSDFPPGMTGDGVNMAPPQPSVNGGSAAGEVASAAAAPAEAPASAAVVAAPTVVVTQAQPPEAEAAPAAPAAVANTASETTPTAIPTEAPTVEATMQPTEQASTEEANTGEANTGEANTGEASTEATIEATVAATPEAVALVAPAAVTNSAAVANAQLQDTQAPASSERSLPLIWIAQASLLLLTVVLASLWWRSRTPHP